MAPKRRRSGGLRAASPLSRPETGRGCPGATDAVTTCGEAMRGGLRYQRALQAGTLPTPSRRLPRRLALPPEPTRAAKRRRDPRSILQGDARAHVASHQTQSALKPRGGRGHSPGGPRTSGPRGRLRQKARESGEAALPRHPRRPAAPGSRPPATLVLARLARGTRLHLLFPARRWLDPALPRTLTCAGSGLGALPPPSSARSPHGKNKAKRALVRRGPDGRNLRRPGARERAAP